MSTTAFTETTDYRRMQCSTCGVVYFFPEKWCEHAAQEATSWNCPNGHGQWFGESRYEKARRERDNLKQQMARVEEEKRAIEREAIAQRERAVKAEAKAKRLTKRAAAGTCPCCKRTFKELAEHMKHQHPEFVQDTGAKVVPIKREKAA